MLKFAVETQSNMFSKFIAFTGLDVSIINLMYGTDYPRNLPEAQKDEIAIAMCMATLLYDI